MPINSNTLHIGGVAHLSTTYEGLLSLTDSLNASGQILGLLNLAMRNPQITIPEVGQILRLDVVLSARIIRIANTAFFFKTTRTCHTIEEALTRVGLREIARLVATSNMRDRAPDYLQTYGLSGEQFNKSVRFTAAACQLIAAEIQMNANLAYLAGLIRPLGILVLNQWSSKHVPVIAKPAWSRVGDLLKWEQATFGLNHLNVSSFITREWGLPKVVSESIEKSSGPSHSVNNCPMTLILQTADALAKSNRVALFGHHDGSALDKECLNFLGIKTVKLIEISREASRKSQKVAV